MRFVVYGAGSIGGVVGARLFQHDHDVVLIARGRHVEAIRSRGLRVQDPGGEQTLPIPAVGDPGQVDWRGDQVCLLAVKCQDSAQALTDLAGVVPPGLPVVCLQNGVRNEYEALRRFSNVYGVPLACPTAHLEAGLVQAFAAPVTGLLDVGRFPAGVDDTATAVAAAFAAARRGPIGERAAAEGEACLVAAGIDAATTQEDSARRADLLRLHPVAGQLRRGGSTWQRLARKAGSIETDYLNGEVVLLGRLHGVPTPVNALLQRLATRLVSTNSAPGSVTGEQFDQYLAASSR